MAGRVVGADEAPIAEADAGMIWSLDDGKMEPSTGYKTEADGRFRCGTDLSGSATAFMAVDAERRDGSVVLVDPARAAEPIEITLGPLIRVRGRFECRELGRKSSWTNATMRPAVGNVRSAHCRSDAAEFDFRLSAGSYQFLGNGTEAVERINWPLELRPDQPDMDLGVSPPAISSLGKMSGKPPIPLHITAARGISKDLQFADFEGKWVILDFWGYGCGACVAQSSPDLVEIWDEHPDDRDKFVALAFHGKQAANFAELDEKLKPVVARTWGGRELPFPILLDATGQTVEEYGIPHWPTTIVINPEGIVVPGDASVLKQALPEVSVAQRMRTIPHEQLAFGLSPQPRLNGVGST